MMTIDEAIKRLEHMQDDLDEYAAVCDMCGEDGREQRDAEMDMEAVRMDINALKKVMISV